MNLGVPLLVIAMVLPGQTEEAPVNPAAENPQVRLSTTKGDIVIELFAEKAPETVESFLAYTRDGHYTDTVFHRVIPGFVIQGGGMTADLQAKPTKPPIQNEAENGLKNERGTLSMARRNDPHSATSQFFINLGNNVSLDHGFRGGWGYAVFGRVVEGMDVVDAIAQVPTSTQKGHRDVPREPVTVISASVVE